jgi:hypothetical protein
MVFLSLVLRPRVNRIVNIVVALSFAVSIIASFIGEEWVYYLLGSAVEVVLLAAIVRTAWTWPRTQVVPSPRPANVGAGIRGREEPLA